MSQTTAPALPHTSTNKEPPALRKYSSMCVKSFHWMQAPYLSVIVIVYCRPNIHLWACNSSLCVVYIPTHLGNCLWMCGSEPTTKMLQYLSYPHIKPNCWIKYWWFTTLSLSHSLAPALLLLLQHPIHLHGHHVSAAKCYALQIGLDFNSTQCHSLGTSWIGVFTVRLRLTWVLICGQVD